MPTFSSFAAIKKYLENEVLKAVDDVLVTDVTQEIKNEEVKVINEVVYGAYESPTQYERRYSDGGIADPDNMIPISYGPGTMVIANVAPFNSGYGTSNSGEGLAELIEYGNEGSSYKYDYNMLGEGTEGDYRVPRPFTKVTANNLRANKRHIQALKNGLKSKGFEVK